MPLFFITCITFYEGNIKSSDHTAYQPHSTSGLNTDLHLWWLQNSFRFCCFCFVFVNLLSGGRTV